MRYVIKLQGTKLSLQCKTNYTIIAIINTVAQATIMWYTILYLVARQKTPHIMECCKW